ncbi:serine/threonine-protein kinase [Actinoplanes sp. NPDC051851]|uniref:serine/threonine-protein kinase n=1 Tax=Actinoplanes sp. NPDC051851 TaxID=3154753 RepID=UPI00342C7E52
MLVPGVVLNGRYQLTQRIAAGGMGEVWRGTDLLLHREIAVKVLLEALMSDAEFMKRFRAEARMMAALKHPGIVQVYDYGENAAVDGQQLDYLVMEFIDGTPLSKRLQQAGRMSAAETMQMMAQVADALQVAHEAGIVHRDVKPSNLLVRANGSLVLVDFGVARSAGVTGITSTNVVMGSAHYMAPEQAEGLPVTGATDQYALGAVAFTCLAGRPPYVGDSPLAVLGQLVHGKPPVLPEGVPGVAGSVVLRALARDPRDRFPSAAALAEASRQAARIDAGVPPAPSSPAGPSSRGYGATGPGGGGSGGYRTAGAGNGGTDGYSSGGYSSGGYSSAGHSSAGHSSVGHSSGGHSSGGHSSGGYGSGGYDTVGGSHSGGYGTTGAGGAGGYSTAGAGGAGANGGYGTTGMGAGGYSATSGAGGYGPTGGAGTGGYGTTGMGAGGAAGTAAAKRRRNITIGLVAAGVVLVASAAWTVARITAGPGDQGQPPAGAGPNGGGPQGGNDPAPDKTGKRDQPGTPTATSTQTGSGGGNGEATGSTLPETVEPGVTVTDAPAATATPTATDDESTTTSPYDPRTICGDGYRVLDQAALKNAAGTLKGRVYLLYQSASGDNCVVTVKLAGLNKKSAVSASLQAEGQDGTTDSGAYQYYAGPVIAAAGGTCVQWGGSIGTLSYQSDFEHCD